MAVGIASLFNPKAKQMLAGWRQTFGRLSVAPVGSGKTAWFHASSLGEFEQARPVLEEFRRRHPEYKICVTFFSPSGFEVRKDYPQADFVCYLPMDTQANAIRFVNLLRPSVAFFAKYDYWFNYLEQLRRRNVPTYIFSAIFRPRQYFFQWYGKWFLRQVGSCFTHLFVQNEESQQLLQSHGIGHVSIAGDTRFDRVHAIAQEAKRNDKVEQFLSLHSGDPVLLAGSSWEPDEELLMRYLQHRDGRLVLILAPHVIGKSHLEWIEKSLPKGQRCTFYSQMGDADPQSRVLIIDNMGMLSSLYRYAQVAYIGGGFGAGIHNILEAVTFGKPVVFGPNYHKFKEACDIIDVKGGYTFDRYEQLEATLDRLFDNDETYRHASQQCTQYMQHNLGATELILALVDKGIPNI
jgi:3-deoxy-D-manno-octulosonic-acid transferase